VNLQWPRPSFRDTQKRLLTTPALRRQGLKLHVEQLGTAEHESALERDFVTLTSVLEHNAPTLSQPLTMSVLPTVSWTMRSLKADVGTGGARSTQRELVR